MNQEIFNLDKEVKTKNNFRFYIEAGELIVEMDSGKQKTISSQDDEMTGLIKLSNDYVFSITENNILKFWDIKGKIKSTFRGHSSNIIYLEEAVITSNDEGNKGDQNVIITISQNEKFVVHDIYGKKLASIDVKMEEPRNFGYNKNAIYISIPNEGLAYYDWSGKQFFKFEGLNEGTRDIKRLNNGQYLTNSNFSEDDNTNWDISASSKFGISLWTSLGKLISSKLDERFGLDSLESVHDFRDDEIIVKSKNHYIYILDSKAEEVSRYRHLTDTTKTLDKIRENRKKEKEIKIVPIQESLDMFFESSIFVRDSIEENTDVKDFTHINNPSYYPTTIPNDKKDILKLEDKSDTLIHVWNFFNRPILNSIFKALQPQERVINKQIINFKKLIKLNKSIVDELDVFISKKQFFLNAIGVLSLLGLFISFVITNIDIQIEGREYLFIASIILILVFLITYISKYLEKRKNKNIRDKIENNNIFLNNLVDHFSCVSDEIDLYRDKIIKQIPIVNDETLYEGQLVEKHISETIENKIEKTALEECGIHRSEVVYKNNKAIVLNDWSLIQNKDEFAKFKINNNDNNHQQNEVSFFPTKKYGVQFAVQYIQFVFLSKDKLDVFTTFFDFIEDEFISKQTYSFYYKDVTNFSRKDVTNIVPFQSKKKVSSHAVELSLSVSSGESISVMIQNDDTFNNILKEIKSEDEDSIEERIEEIELELRELESDNLLNETDKKKRITMLKLDLESIKVTSDKYHNYSDSINQINIKINSIRSQINKYKLTPEE